MTCVVVIRSLPNSSLPPQYPLEDTNLSATAFLRAIDPEATRVLLLAGYVRK